MHLEIRLNISFHIINIFKVIYNYYVYCLHDNLIEPNLEIR